DKDDARPADLWGATWSFPQGAPPAEWWGRSYLPCTLGEAIESIDFESRAHRFVTKVYLQGASLPKDLTLWNNAMDVGDGERGWNTAAFEGASAEQAQINDQLEALEKGRYKLIVWRQLDYEMHVEYVDTKTTGWEPRWMALAKGVLEIEVQ
ncbi:MAG: hypothetical protein HY722_00505, partial [Planctomycetes bacterium]|nr:hypothetical protein [Planctomycetota bacterium]